MRYPSKEDPHVINVDDLDWKLDAEQGIIYGRRWYKGSVI